jgi:glycosyltransferase involved in cell wall biosynthesis
VKVALDVSPLRLSRAGTARYVGGLLPHLEATPGLEVRRLAWGGGGRATAVARDAAWYPAGLPRAARGADVLHCPTHRGPLRAGRTPLVVTVYDLAVLRVPEAFNRWTRLYSRFAVPRVVRAASRVIAISERTRTELVELLGVPGDRVRAIPLGLEEAFDADGPAAEGEYVLAVGTLEPRKNVERLVEATARLGLELRVAGAAGWGGVAARGGHVRLLGHVPDEELARLYRGALCLAYPSLYEGFGIPVLEAMACGAPVVTSADTAMEELADGAAELVDPRDVASIAAGIERALARREELVRAGRERAARFTWAEAARQTVEVYREAAG